MATYRLGLVFIPRPKGESPKGPPIIRVGVKHPLTDGEWDGSSVSEISTILPPARHCQYNSLTRCRLVSVSGSRGCSCLGGSPQRNWTDHLANTARAVHQQPSTDHQ